jgi:hypothetical protein
VFQWGARNVQWLQSPGIVGRVTREMQRKHFDPPAFHGGKFVGERRKKLPL